MLYSFEKKLSKEECRISALYLYMNFSRLCWYKSESLRILSNLKMLLALDVLLLKVMYFTRPTDLSGMLANKFSTVHPRVLRFLS